MKRIGLILLAVVMVAGLAGCSSGDDDADPMGTWAVRSDWGCDGMLLENEVWHVFPTGSFTSASGNGSWSLEGKNFTLTYTYTIYQEDDPGDFAIFVGEISGDEMQGTMSAGPAATGCWSAERTSGTP